MARSDSDKARLAERKEWDTCLKAKAFDIVPFTEGMEVFDCGARGGPRGSSCGRGRTTCLAAAAAGSLVVVLAVLVVSGVGVIVSGGGGGCGAFRRFCRASGTRAPGC